MDPFEQYCELREQIPDRYDIGEIGSRLDIGWACKLTAGRIFVGASFSSDGNRTISRITSIDCVTKLLEDHVLLLGDIGQQFKELGFVDDVAKSVKVILEQCISNGQIIETIVGGTIDNDGGASVTLKSAAMTRIICISSGRVIEQTVL